MTKEHQLKPTNRLIQYLSSVLLIMFSSNAIAQSYSYSSTLCHEAMIVNDNNIPERQSELERYLHQRRKQFSKTASLQKTLFIHNHTSMDLDDFHSLLVSQITSLNESFSVDSLTYQKLTGLSAEDNNNIQTITFDGIDNIVTGDLPWQDWSISDIISVIPESIPVYVYDNLPEEVGLGYAHYPWLGRDQYRRIVTSVDALKLETDYGIMTHLMGHYLGLYSLTGPSDCADDHVSDTPIHNCAMPMCESSEITSTCDNQPMMIDNYMSHAPIDCKDQLTIGQWKRILGIASYYQEQTIEIE